MASPMLSAPDIQDDVSIFEQTSPESLRARALSPPPHDLSTNEEWTSSAETEDDYFPRLRSLKECHSSRSSISSFPASVVHHVQLTDVDDAFHTPSRAQTPNRASKSPADAYLSAFRHPSSIRALQLESEYTDSDALSTRSGSRPRRSPFAIPRSPGSTRSSPVKRSSRPTTPRQQSSTKLKKEFPLVLLHCTLLPPAVAIRGPLVSDEILEAVLPETYRKRWKVLQDKVAKNSEVRQRGVLISHPREDYDLLEERLLETLELARPRIRQGHFLGNKPSADSDSGFESGSQNGSEEASDTEDVVSTRKCTGCGGAVSCKVEQERKWEVKVFAANGLMRSGAWSAAWQEMEKVDIEIGVWMPEEVRTEVEERLLAIQAKEEAEKPVAEEPVTLRQRSRKARSNTARLKHDARMREIYGDEPEPNKHEGRTAPSTSEESVRATQAATLPKDITSGDETSRNVRPAQSSATSVYAPETFVEFMLRHGRILWQDQRNLAIVLLSIMVLFFSIQHSVTTAGAPSQQVNTASITADTLPPITTSIVPVPISTSIIGATSTTSTYATDSGENSFSVQQPTIASDALASTIEIGSEATHTPFEILEDTAGAVASSAVVSGQEVEEDKHEHADRDVHDTYSMNETSEGQSNANAGNLSARDTRISKKQQPADLFLAEEYTCPLENGRS